MDARNGGSAHFTYDWFIFHVVSSFVMDRGIYCGKRVRVQMDNDYVLVRNSTVYGRTSISP